MGEQTKLINNLSRMNENEQKELFAYYSSQTIDRRILIHSMHREVLNEIYSGRDSQNIARFLSLDELSYVSLLLAIKAFMHHLPTDDVNKLIGTKPLSA